MPGAPAAPPAPLELSYGDLKMGVNKISIGKNVVKFDDEDVCKSTFQSLLDEVYDVKSKAKVEPELECFELDKKQLLKKNQKLKMARTRVRKMMKDDDGADTLKLDDRYYMQLAPRRVLPPTLRRAPRGGEDDPVYKQLKAMQDDILTLQKGYSVPTPVDSSTPLSTHTTTTNSEWDDLYKYCQLES